MNKFRERLNLVLKSANISQAELAKRTKMSKTVINNYCTGKRQPSLDSLCLICTALNESADYMLGLQD